MSGLLSVFAGTPRPTGGAVFPTLLDITTTQLQNNLATQVVTLPAVSAGDLLVLRFAHRGSATVNSTTPTFTSLGTAQTGSRQTVLYRIADGSEAGSVSVVLSSAARCVADVFRVQSGTFSGTPEMATGSTGTSVNPDPPNLTPAAGSGNYLWLAMSVVSGQVTTSVYPYADNQANFDSINATNIVTANRCTTTASGTSQDPGAFTVSSSLAWVAHTVAIKGP